MIAVLMTEQ